MILNPYMSGAEVFRIVLRDFGLVSPEDLRRGALVNADVPQLLDTIETFLRSLVAIDSHAVIVLDEAQSLTPLVLDQIRLLTALEKDNRRLVQVVLCGQPALLETLKTEPMLALNDRITRRVTLAPLGSSEVHAYIQHRLAIAGGMHSVTFGPDATAVVAELSRGLPRRINMLCDRSLEEGRFDAVTVITPDLVKRAARAVGMQPLPPIVEPEPPPAAEPDVVPTLTLGQIGEPTNWKPWMVIGGIALFAAAIGAGYAVYARSAVSPIALPSVPPVAFRAGALISPLPVPSDDEIRALLTPRILGPQPPPSAEFPDNSNQLN
jgi:general secretion pathway protein A